MATNLSKENEDFVNSNKNELSGEKVGKLLKKKIKTIDENVESFDDISDKNTKKRQSLRRSSHWKLLKKQFSDEELDFFEEKYLDLMEQFKGNVLKTEEVQLFHSIKLQILMDRNLESKQRARDQIIKLENLQKGLVDKYGGDFTQVERADQDSITSIGEQISSFAIAEQTASKEYIDLQKEHNSLLEKLKASRFQRIDKVDDFKVSFTGLVKKLMDRDFQEAESRTVELFKKSAKKELKRLGTPYKYLDGQPDLPILNVETIENYEKEELKEVKKEEDNETKE